VRILLDADEVLYDFQTPALQLISEVLGRQVQPSDFVEWDIFACLTARQRQTVFDAIGQPGFCTALKPHPAAQQAVTQLQQYAEVFVVTSPFHSPTWVHERQASLRRDFGFLKGHVVHTSAKYVVQGDVLVDDNPSHVLKWQQHNPSGKGFLWHIPNTRALGYDDIRVRSWEDVIEYAKWVTSKGSDADGSHQV